MKKINILITSAGRRVELVQLWKKEIAKSIGNEILLFAADLNPEMSSACYVADKAFKICSVIEKKYPIILLEECLKRNIGLVIPTIDNELIVLSKFKNKFEEYGIKLLISDISLIENCRDKKLTYDFFQSIGLNPPEIYKKNQLKYPLIIKPFNGSSSNGVKKIFSKKELSEFDLKNKDNIFQYCLPADWDEYSVDLLYSKESKLCTLVPRYRMMTRGGEISKGMTKKNELYYILKKKLKYLKGAVGPLTLQVFFNGKNEFSAIELNARFGGGYPMSYQSGANFPDLIIREHLKGENIIFEDNWKENNLFLRYDVSLNVNKN